MSRSLFSGLLQLDQRAAEILWMEEQDRFAMGAELRLGVTEYPHAVPFKFLTCRRDVFDLIADMVDAAFGHAPEKICDRRVVPERGDQLNLGVRQINEHRGHTVLRLRHRLRYRRTEGVAIDGRSLGQIAYGDRHMIQTSDHQRPR